MEKHKKGITPESEHGTISSYVIGFVLSIIFTIIPYYLVVNEVISGTSLTITILGIAVLQMFIQIFFFLHLGRGPKPLYNVVFFFATAGIIVIVVGASLFIMQNLYRNMSPSEYIRRLAQEENISQIDGQETGACNELKESHIIRIKDSKVDQTFTYAYMCDTLTFINEDDEERLLAFGNQGNVVSYGGNFEVKLSKGDPETITLNQAGTFTFRDFYDSFVVGQFTVEE